MKKVLVCFSFLPSLFLLPGCSPEVAPEGKVDIPKVETVEVVERKFETFDGARIAPIELKNFTVNYKVRVEIASDQVAPRPGYSDTYPPMPFFTESVAAYQEGGKYKLIFTHFDKTRSEVLLDVATDQINDFLILNKEGGSSLFLNGKSVWSGARLASVKTLTVGKGYQNRYWSGKVYVMEACPVNPETNIATILEKSCPA